MGDLQGWPHVDLLSEERRDVARWEALHRRGREIHARAVRRSQREQYFAREPRAGGESRGGEPVDGEARHETAVLVACRALVVPDVRDAEAPARRPGVQPDEVPRDL